MKFYLRASRKRTTSFNIDKNPIPFLRLLSLWSKILVKFSHKFSFHYRFISHQKSFHVWYYLMWTRKAVRMEEKNIVTAWKWNSRRCTQHHRGKKIDFFPWCLVCRRLCEIVIGRYGRENFMILMIICNWIIWRLMLLMITIGGEV